MQVTGLIPISSPEISYFVLVFLGPGKWKSHNKIVELAVLQQLMLLVPLTD